MPPPVVNPFTRKPVALSKESTELYKSTDDNALKDFVGRCEVLPEEVNLEDIDSLYEHQMIRSIVDHFYPISLSLETSNKKFFIHQSAIVADALFKLQRFQEARVVVEKALAVPTDSPASEVDSLPGEVSTPVNDKDTEFSMLLSILNCEISISEGKVPLTQLYTLLEELGSGSLIDTHLIFRIQKDICTILLKEYDYDSLCCLLNEWMNRQSSEYCSLYLLAICIFGSEGDSKRLEEMKKRFSDSNDDFPVVHLIDGVLDSMKGEMKSALEHFERTINSSMIPELICAASLNASACYYHSNDLTQAVNTLESLILRDPVNCFDSSVLSNLICVYNELYIPEECELKCRALFSLSQQYHLERYTQKDFGLMFCVYLTDV
ncbi:hypothetical protein JH06_5193 [Blastocystis sp. subtype 4]|uniref:hypothetical protein n=1 Tax=Blastocystis sp. subtype 4 TaxID=944170 RepID=UPI000712232F|nr:hypothetical protein JH06_5193 [Blastocystis sp. subtype 4]KNB41545.1 hypothetical protein JH06_5193 [Blastocystis sp. subtype 4]|eukprot:XP_014524988.1 hypothetical protein JH06_5193 [Blastocystis sp. subtype 4]